MPLRRTERVQRRRAKLCAAGLRPVQLWLPDTSAPEFQREASRQSKLVGQSQESAEALDWITRMEFSTLIPHR
ncbi:MAG TPA: antitoxin MazE family protein [Acetobacteraceae bacterium]|nr:antitoxin MazE family protein [Acetobacteraceae bacterium]